MLTEFRRGKFKQWEDNMKHATCKAAFKRMWQVGPVFKVYDKNMFAHSDADREKYEVVDEKTGKTVDIPHPVAALRIWNAEKGSYDEVESVLDGSPADPAAYWAELKLELETIYSKEEFDDMIS